MHRLVSLQRSCKHIDLALITGRCTATPLCNSPFCTVCVQAVVCKFEVHRWAKIRTFWCRIDVSVWVYSWCHKKGAGLREGRLKGAGLMEIVEGGEGIGKSVPTNGLLVLLRSLTLKNLCIYLPTNVSQERNSKYQKINLFILNANWIEISEVMILRALKYNPCPQIRPNLTCITSPNGATSTTSIRTYDSGSAFSLNGQVGMGKKIRSVIGRFGLRSVHW